jgi:hypothetical protein
MPLGGRQADLLITGITGVSSTNEACTRSTGVGAATGQVAINSTARRHWDPDVAPVLYVAAAGSTSVVSSTNYSVNSVQGVFKWLTGDPSTGTYTADIDYLTASHVAGGREWQLSVEQEAFEVTEFGSSGWRQYQPNLAGATVAIQRYWNDSAFLDTMVADNARFIIELVVNSASGWKYEGFARLNSDQIQTSVDAIVGESANFVIDGELYFTT